MMLVLVTGGRTYANEAAIVRVMTAVDGEYGITHLLHGGAPGADTLAADWAWREGIQVVTCKANWEVYGKRAGPERNAQMALLEPELCVAFPGGRGTANMIAVCGRHGIRVINAAP